MAVKIEDVIKAAKELEKQGAAVTNQTVRKHLGNVGSFTTINAGLRQWRDMKYERRREGQKDFVLTIEEVLNLPEISKAALQYARREFEGECAASQARIDAVEMELERSGDRIDTLDKALSTSEESNKRWREWNEELVRKNAVLEERLTNMTTRMEDLEKQVEHAVEAKAVAERALMSSKERLKLAEGECAAAQARVDAVEMELERSGIRIETLGKDMRTSEETCKKWREWNDELVRKASVLEERLTNMATRMEGLEKHVEQAAEAKAVAERALMSNEERLKLADEQIYQQKVQIKELEKGDEAVEETAEVANLALKRLKQVSRLVDRLKLEHNDKGAVEKVVAEVQAVADRHKSARKPVKGKSRGIAR